MKAFTGKRNASRNSHSRTLRSGVWVENVFGSMLAHERNAISDVVGTRGTRNSRGV